MADKIFSKGPPMKEGGILPDPEVEGPRNPEDNAVKALTHESVPNHKRSPTWAKIAFDEADFRLTSNTLLWTAHVACRKGYTFIVLYQGRHDSEEDCENFRTQHAGADYLPTPELHIGELKAVQNCLIWQYPTFEITIRVIMETDSD